MDIGGRALSGTCAESEAWMPEHHHCHVGAGRYLNSLKKHKKNAT